MRFRPLHFNFARFGKPVGNCTTNVILFSIIALLCTICSACSAPHTAQDDLRSSPLPIVHSTLSKQIDSIVRDSLLAPVTIGIRIISAEDGRALYELNSDKLFHPASNMKLLTTAAGLHILRPTFDFVTQFSTDTAITNGTTPGNFYIKPSGDPLVRVSDLDSLAAQLSAKGIHTFGGNLVGDLSYFDSLSWGKGWMWDDEPDADEAFISPMTVNDNAIELEMHPGNHIGDPSTIFTDPQTSFIEIRNSSVTSLDTLIPPVSVTRRHGENIIRIDGRIVPRAQLQTFHLSVWRPEYYFMHLLRERLAHKGIMIRGGDEIDSARGMFSLGSISHSIDSVIHQINKSSDNIAAENLLKTIAAKRLGSPGSTAAGLTLLKEYLDSLGIDTSKMRLADGSGVSWYNMVSPGAVVQLLEGEYKNHGTFPHFYESLPIAGVDGTLKTRMAGTRAERNVRAKTGTLSGESCISGYVTTLDGKLLVFSILCNHSPGETAHLRSVQDRVLTLLASYDTSHP